MDEEAAEKGKESALLPMFIPTDLYLITENVLLVNYDPTTVSTLKIY